MSSGRNTYPRAARDTIPTDIEQLLERYGREVSPEPAADLGLRVMAAVAQAVPAIGDPPKRHAGRRLNLGAASLLLGPRRLTFRLALVAVLTVGLAAAALAAELRGNADTTPSPAGKAAPVVGSPPAPSFAPSATDDVDAVGPQSSFGEDPTGPDDVGDADDADDDSEVDDADDADDDDDDDDRGEPEEDAGNGTDPPDDEADADGSSGPSTEETGAPDPDEPESEEPAPDVEAAADPEAAPEPTGSGEG